MTPQEIQPDRPDRPDLAHCRLLPDALADLKSHQLDLHRYHAEVPEATLAMVLAPIEVILQIYPQMRCLGE